MQSFSDKDGRNRLPVLKETSSQKTSAFEKCVKKKYTEHSFITWRKQ